MRHPIIALALVATAFASFAFPLASATAQASDRGDPPALYGNGDYVETPRGHIYVEADGTGIPVILVNGGPGADRTVFWGALDFLKDDGFRIVYFDETGVGRATREIDEPFSPLITVEDIEILRRHLGADKVVLAGHSYGGVPALQYALKYPQHVASLLMLSASVDGASQQMNVDAARVLRQTFFPETWEKLEAMRAEGMLSSDERYLDAFYLRAIGNVSDWHDPANRSRLRMFRPTDPRERFNLEVYFDIAGEDPEHVISGTLAEIAIEEELEDFDIPTLILSGRSDWKTTPAMSYRFYKMLPEGVGKLVFLEKTGHWPWVEEPETFEATVTEFLAAMEP